MNKKHILFGKANNTDLLYIKFENHGICTWDGLYEHACELGGAIIRKAGNGDDAPEYRKERLPKAFLRDFNSIVDSPSLTCTNKGTLKKLAKDKGIQLLYHEDLKKYLADNKALKVLQKQYNTAEYDHPEMR